MLAPDLTTYLGLHINLILEIHGHFFPTNENPCQDATMALQSFFNLSDYRCIIHCPLQPFMAWIS